VLVGKVVLEDLVVVAEFEEGLVVVIELLVDEAEVLVDEAEVLVDEAEVLVDEAEVLVDEVEEAGGTVPGGPPTAIRVCWLET
jgi:hypothetical protein